MNDYQDQLETALRQTGVTGASWAYWDGETLHKAVAGLRNSRTQDPVTTDTLMHIGSITKIFNTTLLMQLVDEGKVVLEDPVGKYLPELRLGDMDALGRITCGMLVNHTSGIDGDVLPDHGPDQERVADAIARCAGLGQLHPPGEAASYCNIATVIAGYLSQELAGESWYTLVKTRIFEPLGMEHALADLTDLPRFRCSVGDLRNPATGEMVQTTRPFLPLSFAPAGATLMMSAADLVTFARAFPTGVGANGVRILSEASARRMVTGTAGLLSPPWQIGLGWMILPGNMISHGGGGPGVVSSLYAHPESGRVLALLTNCDLPDPLKPFVVDPILESWTGQVPNESLVSPTAVTPFDAKAYAGTYENNMFKLDIIAEAGNPVARFSTKARIYDTSGEGELCAMSPIGEHAFKIAAMLGGRDAEVKFANPDDQGRMQAIGVMARLFVRTA
ncbi:serine hydrolase domain-containing protein [Sphingosinicella rhizophila]|uniref:Serine hydrolase domain-containing protein n=1 Tax=Sphingosinicella rhizophila TaxID=3050082 RepID=A0ABU3Q9X2_9SPHN|nr:serine hydrolase domain-containing protein [Sphingosinicella sp. GR2756]MDT9600206.1 serine hydrolase domain-containing protein [Sphingosinicella sp. GR2756]